MSHPDETGSTKKIQEGDQPRRVEDSGADQEHTSEVSPDHDVSQKHSKTAVQNNMKKATSEGGGGAPSQEDESPRNEEATRAKTGGDFNEPSKQGKDLESQDTVMARIRQVFDDKSIKHASLITFLSALALELQGDQSIAITQEELAAKAKMSVRTVDAKTKDAVALGYIEVETKGSFDRSKGTNVYTWTKEGDGP